MLNIKFLTVFSVSLATLAGCQQNLIRSDLISEHTGDSVAANISNQTVDPWPSYVNNNNIETSSQRQSDVRSKYINKHKPKDQSASALTIPIGATQPSPPPPSAQ